MKIDNIIIQIIGNWIDQMQKKKLAFRGGQRILSVCHGSTIRRNFDHCNSIFCYYLYATICEWTDFSCFIFDFAKKNWWFSYEDI